MSNQVKQEEYEVYQRIKLLGKGSFGQAFLVKSTIDNKKYVVKQVDLNNMSESEKQETIKEARILEALHHPNIIKFIELYKTKKNKLCIVMDFADGGDLANKIKDQKGQYFQENQILDWFTQICLAMKHVHDRKILHRDLKSQNIFLTKANIIKLGDFGIARELQYTMQKVKTMVGTPYYLSPEIIQSKPYSFKSDVWSLGIILYELCMLRPPFNGESIHSLGVNIVGGRYQQIGSHFSKELRNLISQCLSQDPYKRPSVAQILKMPFVRNRIRHFLSESVINYEFSHTILHNKNVLKEQQQKKKQQQQQQQQQKQQQLYRQQQQQQQQQKPQNYKYPNLRQNWTPQNKQPQSRLININNNNNNNGYNNPMKRQSSQPEMVCNNQLQDIIKNKKEQMEAARNKLINEKRVEAKGKHKEEDVIIEWIGGQKVQDKYNQDKYNQDKYNQDKYNQDKYGQDKQNQDKYNNYQDKYNNNQDKYINNQDKYISNQDKYNNQVQKKNPPAFDQKAEEQILESLNNSDPSLNINLNNKDDDQFYEEELRVYSKRQIDEQIWKNDRKIDKNDEYNQMFKELQQIMDEKEEINNIIEEKEKMVQEKLMDVKEDSFEQMVQENQWQMNQERKQSVDKEQRKLSRERKISRDRKMSQERKLSQERKQKVEVNYEQYFIDIKNNPLFNNPTKVVGSQEIQRSDIQIMKQNIIQLIGGEKFENVYKEMKAVVNDMNQFQNFDNVMEKMEQKYKVGQQKGLFYMLFTMECY